MRRRCDVSVVDAWEGEEMPKDWFVLGATVMTVTFLKRRDENITTIFSDN